MRNIKRAAVVGAGAMGASIAAHLANVGIPSLLLSILPPAIMDEDKNSGVYADDPDFRNKRSRQSIENLRKITPSPLYLTEDISLLSPGFLEDNLQRLADVDWIIEAATEDMAAKKKVLGMIEQYWQPGIIVSTNTSGLSVNEMVSDCSPEFRKSFLGTHFFNPPRYMKLLELIPADDTDPVVVEQMKTFARRVLGKGVVVAKDTPNFIANRIGVYVVLSTMQAMQVEGLTVEEVDAVTGIAMGRPKSATFRTMDMVGLDVVVHVMQNIMKKVSEPWEKERFIVPASLNEMFNRCWFGGKTGQGFYKKENGERKEILALDLAALEYRRQKMPQFDGVDAALKESDVAKRVRALTSYQDRAGRLAWKVLSDMMVYAALKVEEIAEDIVSVDNAMRWGFNWELGPFETWDALGLAAVAERMQQEGRTVPSLVTGMLAAGVTSFYRRDGGRLFFYDLKNKAYREAVPTQGELTLTGHKEQAGVVMSNPGASLVEIGDGVVCLELHPARQAIGPDVITMINKAVDVVDQHYQGMVIASQAKNFCVGGNLMMILMEAQAEEWDELDLAVRQFQQAMMRLKYCSKPVVAAPHAMALGGGYEVTAHCDRIVAAAETYMGLVELGAGLVPAGGGTKEMLLRRVAPVMETEEVDLLPLVASAFMTVALAKVSTSGKEAKKMGYMNDHDRVVVNQDRLLYEAKQLVLWLNETGYTPPTHPTIRVIGETGLATLQAAIYNMKEGNYITGYDAFLAEQLAFIMCGGRVPFNTRVTEQYLLDLEREAFLHLCRQRKTQERMAHLLKTGKPLRN